MTAEYPLVQRLIVLIKQHRHPSKPKSTAVLLKIMEPQILNPGNHSVEEFKAELEKALASDIVWSTTIRQQHSEEELRGCFSNLLNGIAGTTENE